jgi:RNA polymerase sigma-19 factor, ECF subfamily
MTVYVSYSDTELMQLLHQGEDVAFTELYNRYWKILFQVAAGKTNSLAEAEEMVQDLFMDIWKRRATIDITSNPRAYLAVALKYRIINLLAKRQRRIRFEQKAEQELTIADSSTEQWLSFNELNDRISRLVADLPERCRLVYQLKKEEGYSQREIAARLRISEKAVEANISRALKALRVGIRSFLSFYL